MPVVWTPDKPEFIAGGFIRAFSPSDTATTLPITETWTVGDAAGTLNGDRGWSDHIGAHGWGVVSQAAQLANTGGLTNGGRLNVDLGVDDYQVTLTITQLSVDPFGLIACGPCVRMQGTGVTTFYTSPVVQVGSDATVYLFRFVAGVQTPLASAVVTAHAGMTIRLRVEGDDLRAYVDGIPVIHTADNAIPTGHYAGLQGVANGASSLVRVDNWTVALPALATAFVPLELRTLQPLTGVY